MKSNSFFDNIHLFLGAYTVLWLNAGNFGYIGSYIPSVVKFGLVAFWILLSFVKHSSFVMDYAKMGWPLGVFAVMMMASFSTYADQYRMQFIYCLIILALFCYYFNYGTHRELKILLIVFLVDIIIVSVHTYVVLLENPIIARALSTGAAAKEDLLEGIIIPKGVGGYGLCYQLCFIAPLMSYFFNKKKFNGIIKLITFAFVLLLLFQAQFTLALIIYIISIIVSFSYGKKGTINLLVARFVIFVIAILLIINIEAILKYAIELSNAELAARLNEILNFIRESDTSGSDISSRLDLYQKSLKSFGNNIIIGSFGAKTYGSHSTFLDLLGAFGIIGGLGYVGLMVPMFTAKKYVDNAPGIKKPVNLSILVIIITSIINVIIGTETMMVVSFVLPIAIKFLYDDQVLKNEIDTN